MALSLYVATDRWRAHQRSVLTAFPGTVPVAKGNGYGLRNRRLAEEATLLGAGMLAVGTVQEAAAAQQWFEGDLLVLTPYRISEDGAALSDRVVRTVSTVDGAQALAGGRIVVECMTSLRRHGVREEDLVKLRAAIGDAPVEGFAVHLPLERPDGSDPVDEVSRWVERLQAAALPVETMFVSHLDTDALSRLGRLHPGTDFRSRIGTRLWLGDEDALECRATVLDVTGIARGERYGYRQQKAAGDGRLLVVTGGTAHGVGLEAPKYVHGLLPRAKGIARAGLASVNRTLSPFTWTGRQLWFAEPPHMQVSILHLPAEIAPPAVGEELRAVLRHTTTHFDRIVDH
ncbi:alanine racemase [Peterkaempfera bronchialis]|uniref:alanine racemase n=1 Tax=Peterkaempfera bronchialis TaxID=2126346 RepID=UPI003C2BA02E